MGIFSVFPPEHTARGRSKTKNFVFLVSDEIHEDGSVFVFLLFNFQGTEGNPYDMLIFLYVCASQHTVRTPLPEALTISANDHVLIGRIRPSAPIAVRWKSG
jgi:hypothetical protein